MLNFAYVPTVKEPVFSSDVDITTVSDKSTHDSGACITVCTYLHHCLHLPASLSALTCMILMHNWQTSSWVLGCWKTYEEECRKKYVLILLRKQNILLDKLNIKAKTWKTTLASLLWRASLRWLSTYGGSDPQLADHIQVSPQGPWSASSCWTHVVPAQSALRHELNMSM